MGSMSIPDVFRAPRALLGGLSLIVAVSLAPAASAQDAEATPGVVGDAAEIQCVTDLGTSEAPDGALSFVVNSEESVARYRVEEEIAGAGLNEAVGETNAVIGTILVSEDGEPLPCSRFDVDLRTLQTDEARRDARVQETLATDEYPLATFIVTEIQMPDGGLADGEETELVLFGNLELHGVSNQVSWMATVTRDGNQLRGSATTIVPFAAYEVDKPVMGPVMSIEDNLTLEMEIVADLAS